MRDKLKIISVAAILLLAGFTAHAGKFADGYRSLIDMSPSNPYFPVLALLGFILAIASFHYPRFGLIVMLFFMLIATDMPVGEKQATERQVTVRVEDIVLIIVSLGWLLHRAKTRTLSIIKHVPIYKPIVLMAGCMVIATIIGILQGTVSVHRGFFFTMKRLEYFWVFFMAFHVMDGKKEAARALYILLAATVVVAFAGMVQFFMFPLSELSGGGSTGGAGYGRANTMGDFLLIIIGVTLGLLAFENSPRKVMLFAFVLFVCTGTLIMTKSRGSYVSMVPLLLAILFFSKSPRVFSFILYGGICVALYVLVTNVNFNYAILDFLLVKHKEDINSQFSQIGEVIVKGPSVDPSMDDRVRSWKSAVPEILQYPFFGQGCGAKNLAYGDCQYVHEALETGLIGVIMLLYMNFCIFLVMHRYFRRSKDVLGRSLALGFMGSLAAVMTHGITMNNFYTILNMEVFWLVVAIIMIFYYEDWSNGELEEQGYPTRTPAPGGR